MICSTPIAQVSLIDEDRQWTKASFGVPRQETSRLSSFCTHTIERKELFCVEDAQLDEQFRHNPFVTGDLNLRFYAGMPLVIKGNAIGALCVIDKVPRKLSDAQNDALTILAHQVQIQLEVRNRQKQLELALIDQQQLALLLQHNFTELTLFLDSVAVILIGLDPAGTITRWNATASSMFGISRDEVMYKRLDECGIQWLEGTINLAEWLADTESEKRIDAVFITEAGKRWLGMTIRRLPQQNANLSFEYLVSATDTTNHRMLEEQVRQAHKLNAIGGLAAGIAHEINSPTQFIGDNISFIRDSWMELSEAIRLGRSLREGVSEALVSAPLLEAHDAAVKNADLDYVLEEYPKAMDQALDGVQRIASIVNAMKEFSHPGSQNKVLLDLHHCINTAIALARNEWKYVADVVTEFDPELPPLFCHAVEIGQVLLNLIVNAGHAISERAAKDPSLLRGQIVIFTRHRDQEAEIRIQDNGCGIPDSITSRVFEPFFTTKEVGKGTGQGLAIAHSIVVNKHGGRLWFESPLDGGTCFIIRIPICDPILSASMIPLNTGTAEEFS